MQRKKFIKNSLLATGAVLLPNTIWAFDKNFPAFTNANKKFVTTPNLKRFKVSTNGIKFFESKLSILNSQSKLKFNREYFISEDIKGYCTPSLLETNRKESFAFIPELYKDKKHNGFIVKICADGLCEETKVFTHENQGYFAFWGKEYLGHPTLYHYNFETLHLMRMHWENDQWINHRVMPIYPNAMIALYKQQLQQVTEGQLTQQFGYDFDIHKDGFYQFLALKNDWEQDILTKEKEKYENEHPAKIYSNTNEVLGLNTGFENLPDGYSNPFVPIYCKGDDLSHATIKPTIIYEEVAGTKIEIPNMPAYKTQDDIGDCKAFSLAVLLQYYICQKWKNDITDCTNPPPDSAISYFGLMAYTNQIQNQSNTFQVLQKHGESVVDVIDNLSKSGNQLILENCKPFENLTNKFSLNGSSGLIQRDNFFNYLKSIYENLKTENPNLLKDCTKEVNNLNGFVDLKFNQITLKTALTKNNYEEFLYTLFFSECKKENFPSGFRAVYFPLDSMNVTIYDVKNQIIKGLNLGKPVLLPSLCASSNQGDICNETHSLVVSGFKKVRNGTNLKDIFKLHNSWGVEWQKKNNNGWVDADLICQNTAKVRANDGSYRIGSSSVVWLD